MEAWACVNIIGDIALLKQKKGWVYRIRIVRSYLYYQHYNV
jgi:hypothetical protein